MSVSRRKRVDVFVDRVGQNLYPYQKDMMRKMINRRCYGCGKRPVGGEPMWITWDLCPDCYFRLREHWWGPLMDVATRQNKNVCMSLGKMQGCKAETGCETMPEMNVPPRGLRPYVLACDDRVDEILSAMLRYRTQNYNIPTEWGFELLKLLELRDEINLKVGAQ